MSVSDVFDVVNRCTSSLTATLPTGLLENSELCGWTT